MPVYGNDLVYLKLNNVTINCYSQLYFDVEGSHLKLTNLTFNGDFENGEVHIFGLNWIGKILNYFIDVKTLWNAMKNFVFSILNQTLTAMINEEMEKCDIIGIVAGDCVDKINEINETFTEILADKSANFENISIFDSYLASILQNFSVIMKDGYQEIGIPVMDPFQIPNFDTPYISNDVISADITIANFSIANLSTFHVISVNTDFANFTMNLQLQIPMLR